MNAARKYSIAWKGLSEGEHTFEFEAGDDLFRLFENTEIKSGHCDVKVNLLRAARQLRLGISIRSGGMRPLPGRLLRSDRLRRGIAGEVLRRSPRIRRRHLMALAFGGFRGSGAIYLRKHRPFSALPAGAPRRGVRSGRSKTRRNSGKARARVPDNGPNNCPPSNSRWSRKKKTRNIKLIIDNTKWHILNTKSRQPAATSAERTTKRSFPRS